MALFKQDRSSESGRRSLLSHPIFAWLGVRSVLGQHTAVEETALQRWAAGRTRLVEIGVAEGASALRLRESMSPHGTLWLVDPFHLSRWRRINTMKRAAHRAVGSCRNGRVVWIERFSFDAARDWQGQIDFLFIDGDHSEQAVQRDWEDWSRFVVRGGVVAFHDARTFAGGWPQPDWGPVRAVEKLFRAHPVSEWRVIKKKLILSSWWNGANRIEPPVYSVACL